MKLLKLPTIHWVITRKQAIIQNNYNDFLAYVEFKLTNRDDVS